MSIANDAWIRRMALEHGMIKPFEEGQVAKGKISYGVSSYGYDVRVGTHFKIFHNLNSTLVDPKNFDAKSFVDHDGDHVIIPPNSFVLAETVERFRMPREVLAVCLGKCLSGDTRIVDADTGEYLPIREFSGRRATIGLDGWLPERLGVTHFVPQGVKPVFRLRTKMGHEIVATANHPFRQLAGWTPLSDLRPGDRIAAARRVPVFGTTPLAHDDAARCGRDAASRAVPGAHGAGVPQEVFRAPAEAVRTFLRAFLSVAGELHHDVNAAWFEVALDSRRLAEDARHLLLRFGVVSSVRALGGEAAPALRLRVGDPAALARLLTVVGFEAGSECRRRAAEVRSSLLARTRDAVRVSDSAEPSPTWTEESQSEERGVVWDVVVSIEPAGEEEVFDLTVPGAENFLANDLVVHNSTYARCGIIVNVTPLEPEWEGVITIEISNTTPLPAKIYANEGIAQILFLRAAADGICETSYADRKGKYQNQGGLTLPKIAK